MTGCSEILLRYGKAVARQGPIRAESTKPKPITELRARDPWLARSAADYLINNDRPYDDWIVLAYSLRGAFGDDGEAIWRRFSEQSAKNDPDETTKVWAAVTQAERDGLLRSGAGTIIDTAQKEGWTPPPSPGLPPYFDGAEQDVPTAIVELRTAIAQWIEQSLAYRRKRRGKPPRHAIAGGIGLGKTKITLQILAALAQGQTVHYYAPTLELAEEVVAEARDLGLPAVLVRGRETNKNNPTRWPALCLKEDAAADIARTGGNVYASLCKDSNSECPHYYSCPWIAQWQGLEGKLIVMAHEYITLPKPLAPKPDLVVIDEQFYSKLLHHPSLRLERVTAQRIPPRNSGHFQGLSRDARIAIAAVEAGQTTAEVGLTPERLRQMAKDEERLAAPPSIWPDLNYGEQKKRAKLLTEIEAYKLAKLWRVLAKDHDRVTQRVIVARGIEWYGEVQDRVFIHTVTRPLIERRIPVLLIDADHDPLIGDATLPTNHRTVITPKINAFVTQVSNTVCSRRKLLNSPARRRDVLAMARCEAAKGRRVLIGTYKPVAPLLRDALTDEEKKHIKIVHFGAIRGLDCYKGFETVIIAGREQCRAVKAEDKARALFGMDPERLLLMGDYVTQVRGYSMRDGSRMVKAVQVHCDLRVQAVVEQGRECESAQMAGRARLVHRNSPCHVFLLSNLPTVLPVDRLAEWAEIIPSRFEQAIVAGRGVLPLSYAELARAHPTLWANAQAVRDSLRKGGNIPRSIFNGNSPTLSVEAISDAYWNVGTLSAKAVEVTYRRPGQVRGSPHKAIVPADGDPAAALTALLGPVERVTVIGVLWRPTAVVEDEDEPAPLIFPFPGDPDHLVEPELSFAFSGGGTVQRSRHGHTVLTVTVKRVGRAADRGPEARAGPCPNMPPANVPMPPTQDDYHEH